MTLVYANTSNIVDGQSIDAADVKAPIDSLDTALDAHLNTSRSANTFWGAPSGGAGAPSYRAITATDLISAMASPPAIGGTTPAKVTGTTLEAKTNVRISRPSGTSRSLVMYTDNGTPIPRWSVETTADAESPGSGAQGSNFRIGRFDDVGAFLGDSVNINRLSGEIAFGSPISIFGNLATGQANRITLCAVTATPIAGWGGAPSGYFKGFNGATKIAIPYWNAV